MVRCALVGINNWGASGGNLRVHACGGGARAIALGIPLRNFPDNKL
jgi:hypothetical protein